MESKENKKTLTYILVAGMALLVAWEPWRPAPADTSVPDQVGQQVFPKFENPLAAKSLEIVTFNEETAAIRDFKVAQTNGVWSIPSHSNYPADAAQHMAQAATSLMDLKILSMVSDRPGDQKTYGVITPDPKDLKVGMTGVGTRVTIRDAADKVLADLVIGKQVKDAPQLHYVREADRDFIYTVAVKTDEFSTKFGDWIEKDLLKLNAFDVRQIELNDYSTRSGITPEGQLGYALEKRSEIDLGFDDAKSQWTLIEMKEFGENQQEPTVVTLGEGEELNTEKLNAMKTSLDDLQIVDVERKPSGLSQDLKASDEFVKNREAFMSLQQRGFLPLAAQGEPLQIYSTEGEVTCATKDGVKYVLRFGNLADTIAAEGDEKAEDGSDATNGPSRFLFVTAQFDESMIPKPELQPLPGEAPAAEDQGEEKPADESNDAEPRTKRPRRNRRRILNRPRSPLKSRRLLTKTRPTKRLLTRKCPRRKPPVRTKQHPRPNRNRNRPRRKSLLKRSLPRNSLPLMPRPMPKSRPKKKPRPSRPPRKRPPSWPWKRKTNAARTSTTPR